MSYATTVRAEIGADFVRQTHVDREISQIEDMAQRLEMAANSLAEKINPIICFAGTNEAKTSGAPEEMIAPLADRLRVSRRRFEKLEANLNSLIAAIEL